MPRTKQPSMRHKALGREHLILTLAVSLGLALVLSPALSHAQLTKDEKKCVSKLTGDGSKVTKAETKLQGSCVKGKSKGDVANTDTCVRPSENTAMSTWAWAAIGGSSSAPSSRRMQPTS